MRKTQQGSALAALGKTIREIRESREITQEALAELCDLHVNYVSLIERGQSNPTVGTLLLLAAALDVAPQDLFRAVVVPDLTSLRRNRSRRGRRGATGA